MRKIKAFVCQIQSNRYADVSEKVRITANYECANVHSTIEFDVPISEAREFYVGEELEMIIERK